MAALAGLAIALAAGVGSLVYATPVTASDSTAVATPPAGGTEAVRVAPPSGPLLTAFFAGAPAEATPDLPASAASSALQPAPDSTAPVAVPASTPPETPAAITTASATAAAREVAAAAAVTNDDGVVRAASAGRTVAAGAGTRVAATVSYYYCQQGTRGIGDGGGFCGAMRDGTIVYDGAAACAYAYLGQRFRIEGDPRGLVYKCADTGNLVGGQHRDIWFHGSDEGRGWLDVMGRSVTIEILP